MYTTALDISFTESDYRANEKSSVASNEMSIMPVKVTKNSVIATAVVLEVVPLTYQQAEHILSPSLREDIPENNLFSPPFASKHQLDINMYTRGLQLT